MLCLMRQCLETQIFIDHLFYKLTHLILQQEPYLVKNLKMGNTRSHCRKLLPRERNYSVVQNECLAIVWSTESLNYYLSEQKFTIETDHNPLTWLTKMKDKNQRLLRWAPLLQQYTSKLINEKKMVFIFNLIAYLTKSIFPVYF